MHNIKKVMMGAAGVSKGPEGSLWSWGAGYSGAIGDGAEVARSSPNDIWKLVTSIV